MGKDSPIEEVTPFKEAADEIRHAGAETLKLCFQCGLCTVSCPWNTVRTFNPHRMLRQAQFGLCDLEKEEWWLCTTCSACVSRCPRGVSITDVMLAVRTVMMKYQMVPTGVRHVKASLGSVGNPMGEPQEKRADWVKDLNVKPFTTGTDWLYFPCCIVVYDPNADHIARATAGILKKMGENFGILGVRENCCGESIHKTGSDGLFEYLAKSNINAFNDNRVTRIVVNSPHCYTTFKYEYPKLGGNFKVVHLAQYLAGLVDAGKLKFSRKLNKKAIYHDPCYLGRHNGIYDEPRSVLKSIPGLELMDEVDARENSLCCGGGGGRIWMETKKGERFSDTLVEQAVKLGADVLVTACPYCILNLKDSLLTTNKESALEIKDLSELVNGVI